MGKNSIWTYNGENNFSKTERHQTTETWCTINSKEEGYKKKKKKEPPHIKAYHSKTYQKQDKKKILKADREKQSHYIQKEI